MDKAPYVAKYRDISLDGVGVMTVEPLTINTQVRIALNTKKKGLMLVEGKVCWSKKEQGMWHSGILFNRKLSFEPATIS